MQHRTYQNTTLKSSEPLPWLLYCCLKTFINCANRLMNPVEIACKWCGQIRLNRFLMETEMTRYPSAAWPTHSCQTTRYSVSTAVQPPEWNMLSDTCSSWLHAVHLGIEGSTGVSTQPQPPSRHCSGLIRGRRHWGQLLCADNDEGTSDWVLLPRLFSIPAEGAAF